MAFDLTSLLRDWGYEPGQINVRLITGDDGTPKIQMRLDLGVLQMEATGRPDGLRPYGYDSLLEYFETALDEHASEDDPDDEAPDNAHTAGSRGSGGAFMLSDKDCRELREEAVQYYHRYISLLVLSDYLGVVRDTSRNLRVLDLCREHAADEDNQEVLEQFRPYITMMRTRALASLMVAENEANGAVVALDEGIANIRDLYDAAGRLEEADTASEIQLLVGMRQELVLKLPASQKNELRERLRKAIQDENYELAAILRDELKMLKD